MSWVLGVSILLSICRVYIYFEVYVRLIMSSYLFFVSTPMFGISRAIQNDTAALLPQCCTAVVS